jgi:hypothetical protein
MAANKHRKPKYYVLEAFGKNHDGVDNRMSLYDVPDPSSSDDWVAGHKFKNPPREPVVVTIKTGHEHRDLMPLCGGTNVMSNEFYKALCDAGVTNIDAYDAVLRSEDKKVEYRGFKAYNILGLVRAADLAKTKFRDPPGSRLIDASIETLAIDADKAMGLLIFRLAEYVGAKIVHERVKEFIEPMNFPYVQFNDPGDFTS